ncbi:hypothetical protein PTMSG1_10445 [Pyrenophora teres f. maculata]|nr:hypothetical protein PTMSG1_10445 [Pyrenophora teres f. maculata]
MTTTVRLDPWDLGVAHDEELPAYDDMSTPPAYDGGAFDGPFITYRLRQYDSKIQILAAYDAPAASSYRFTTNSFRVFSKKPELEVLHTRHDFRQRSIAAICFNNKGGFPWRPRAYFDYTSADGQSTRHDMESVNFEDWTVAIGDESYVWMLEMRPISLVLCERSSGTVIARFTFSEKGVLASRGAEVGELSIYRRGLAVQEDGIHKLACSMMVVLTFLKRMGRNYMNPRPEGPGRAGSLSRDRRLRSLHRGSTAGYSTMGN